MFDELNKYKQAGHFFFKLTDNLSSVCNAPNDCSGIYLIYALEKESQSYLSSEQQDRIKYFKKKEIAKLGEFIYLWFSTFLKQIDHEKNIFISIYSFFSNYS